MPLSQSQNRPALNNIESSSAIQSEIYLSRVPVETNESDNHNGHLNINHFPAINNDDEQLPSVLPTLTSSALVNVPISSSEVDKNQTPNKTCSSKQNSVFATPEKVVGLYYAKLTPYERKEIFNYSHIYFIGANSKKRPGIIGSPNNCGYDNEQGSYMHVLHDHIAYRFEVLKVGSNIKHLIFINFKKKKFAILITL